MSTQCSHFVQNAWKKELCANCFKPREEHVVSDAVRLNIGKASSHLKNGSEKIQGILRARISRKDDQNKKTVAFPESLTEVIGYGGDDFSDTDEAEEYVSTESLNLDVEMIPDSEEERALGNLTRANTNFNTITANLSDNVMANDVKPASTKSFASLMLGRIQKDSDGRKTTLLVSITPFGGDEILPKATRPVDKKQSVKVKNVDSVVTEARPEVILKSVKKIDIIEKEEERKLQEPSELEKIVDMPLITSSNRAPVLMRKESLSNNNDETTHLNTDEKVSNVEPIKTEKKATSISRTPAIKKSENEKPKITIQNNNNYGKIEAKRIVQDSRGVELNLTPLMKSDAISVMEINEINVSGKSLKENREELDPVPDFPLKESRELAGEPDGKADEMVVESDKSQVKPVTPTEPRPSFLHGEAKVRPVVPQKPVTPKTSVSDSLPAGLCAKNTPSFVPPPPSIQSAALRLSKNLTVEETPVKENSTAVASLSQVPSPSYKKKPPPLTFKSLPAAKDEAEAEESQESGAEFVQSPNKRRMAPKPPEITEDVIASTPVPSLFVRNPGMNLKSDSPVVREKEKRERASSCSPKFRKAICEPPEASSPSSLGLHASQMPEPAPRRNISLSQDSLATNHEVVSHSSSSSSNREEKKRGRSRFSLKRFLRMGSKKDIDMTANGANSGNGRIDEIPTTPQPKPRLEIIHPLELNGAAVEVVGNNNDRLSRINGDDQVDSKSDPVQSNSRLASASTHSGHATARPGKPPPPPRNQSLDEWSRLDPSSKPVRPPPPRLDARSEKISWQSSASAVAGTTGSSSTSDSIYANLAPEDVTGEVRSALAPSKPQRTASMRDQTVNQPLVKKSSGPCRADQHYEPPPTSESPTSNDSHVYECLSSSPECDSSLELRHGNELHSSCKRKSDSSTMESNADFKYHHRPFTRSASLPYCGSETESELYAPYSFYTGDEGPEEDQDWKSKDEESKINRLRQRRGRSIVHRSLEDNYGAVVVANHEALAQFLEQLNQVSPIPQGLRALKNSNPRLSDFALDPGSSVPIGRRIFYAAIWNEQNVSLCIAFDLAMHVSRKEFYLTPIVEFIDTVPEEIAKKIALAPRKDVEATISVLPRLQVNSIESFGALLAAKDESNSREAFFVLLQFVNALKNLQARGMEEASRSLSNVVLCKEDKDACYRLYLLQGLNVDTCDERDDERVSLCQCALVALRQLHLANKLPLIQELLMREKAVTLSQVKSILEFSLWGPEDLTLGGPREREIVLQRWLDLERATVLHALVRAKAPLTVTEEYQLLFLVRTSAKIMCEASLLLDKQRSLTHRT